MSRKPKGPFRVTVRGIGDFPIDMLRYDRAYPDNEAQSGLIHNSLYRHRQPGSELTQLSVKLIMPVEPTRGRWESFGWSVENVEALG